ncbi:hypothetical protein ACSSVY_002572 [Roseovarius sp. MBR-51]
MMFNLDGADVRHDPFPIAFAKPVFDADLYQEMLDNWPDTERFQFMPKLGNKYSLSEVNNGKEYHDFIKSNPVWKRFHDEVKSERFVRGIVDFLASHNIDLDLGRKMVLTNTPGARLGLRLTEALCGAALVERRKIPLRSRFEFSMMPGDGGSILPHTDAPAKLITVVVSMVAPGEWKPEYGGGTSVVWPKDKTRSFNFRNTFLPFEEVDTLDCYEFNSNQCMIFVKTFNSWHAVEPIKAPRPDMFRRSLTINIEVPKS